MAKSKKTKNRYRVLAGTHTEADGEMYQAGDVVSTSVPLDEMFLNKFEKEGSETMLEEEVDPRDISPANAPTIPSRSPTEDSMQGTDNPERGMRDDEGIREERKKRKAEEEETTRELEERTAAHKQELESSRAQRLESRKKKAEEPDDDDDEEGEFGADVTDRFDGAAEGGFQVYKGESGYTIVDSTEPGTALQEPVRNKKDVASFIDKRSRQK